MLDLEIQDEFPFCPSSGPTVTNTCMRFTHSFDVVDGHATEMLSRWTGETLDSTCLAKKTVQPLKHTESASAVGRNQLSTFADMWYAGRISARGKWDGIHECGPEPHGQRPQKEWLWNEQTRGWDKNPAYFTQNIPQPAPTQKVKWRGLLWLGAAVLVAGYLINAWSPTRNEDRTNRENSSSPTTSANGDGTVRAALERAAVTPEAVTALGLVGDETGYGICKSTPMNQEQRENFAYAIVLLCREISAGDTSWEESVNEDLYGGAAVSDA